MSANNTQHGRQIYFEGQEYKIRTSFVRWQYILLLVGLLMAVLGLAILFATAGGFTSAPSETLSVSPEAVAVPHDAPTPTGLTFTLSDALKSVEGYQ